MTLTCSAERFHNFDTNGMYDPDNDIEYQYSAVRPDEYTSNSLVGWVQHCRTIYTTNGPPAGSPSPKRRNNNPRNPNRQTMNFTKYLWDDRLEYYRPGDKFAGPLSLQHLAQVSPQGKVPGTLGTGFLMEPWQNEINELEHLMVTSTIFHEVCCNEGQGPSKVRPADQDNSHQSLVHAYR
jgi:hypothetical protein